MPAPTTDADGPDDLPDRPARQAARRSSPTSSPTGRAPTRTERSSATVGGRAGRAHASGPGPTTRPGASGSAASSSAALPVLGERDRPALAARGRRSSSRRRSAARPAATPGCSTRRGGSVEVAYYADDFVVLHEAAHTLVQRRRCWPIAGRTRRSPRTTRLEAAADLKVKATGDELTAELGRRRSRSTPGARSGARPRRPRTTPTPRPSRSPGRSPSGPGTDGLQAVWRRRRQGRRVPAAGGHRAATAGTSGTAVTDAAEPNASSARPTGAACSTCSRSGPARRTTTCGGRGSPGPRTCRCSTSAPMRATHYDAVVDEAGGWRCRARSATRCAPGSSTTAGGLLDEAAAVLEQRDAIARAAADAGLTPPDNLRAAFEGNDGLRRCTCRGRPGARRHRSLRRRGRAPTGKPGPVHAARAVRGNPEADLTAAATAYPPVTSTRSAAAADEARRPGLGGGRRTDPRGGHRPDHDRHPPAPRSLARRPSSASAEAGAPARRWPPRAVPRRRPAIPTPPTWSS